METGLYSWGPCLVNAKSIKRSLTETKNFSVSSCKQFYLEVLKFLITLLYSFKGKPKKGKKLERN